MKNAIGKAIGAGTVTLMLLTGVASAQQTYNPQNGYGTNPNPQMQNTSNATNSNQGSSTQGSTSTPTNNTSQPRIPNTGAGGSATENALMLAAAGLVAAGGLLMLRKRV